MKLNNSKRLPSTNIEIRTDKTNSKGEAPLYIRITINRRNKYISLKKYVNPDHFDKKAQKMKAGKNIRIDRYIDKEKGKIDDIILDLHRNNRPITFETILNLYKKGENQYLCIRLLVPDIRQDRLQHRKLRIFGRPLSGNGGRGIAGAEAC